MTSPAHSAPAPGSAPDRGAPTTQGGGTVTAAPRRTADDGSAVRTGSVPLSGPAADRGTAAFAAEGSASSTAVFATAVDRAADPAPVTAPTAAPVLRVTGLGVSYPRRDARGGDVAVLTGVDLEVTAGQILGVIGETGSGKTTLARGVVGLAPVTAGRIAVEGVEVTGLRGRELRAHRRSGRVQYMFQDPLRSLDPDLTVVDLVGQPLAVAGVEKKARRERVGEALHRVGLEIDALGERIPAQLSGGQRQRVSLARAIVTRPALLLADEPVSALDASNRNHVLRLLDELRRDLGVAVVVISHDLSSLAGIADRIAVLYRGRLVEQGPTAEVLSRPLHPYTALLTASAPRVDRADPAGVRVRDRAVPEPPAWAAEPGACVFAHRCPFAHADCRTQPGSSAHPGERSAACHHPVTTGH